ncbi:MULTISPECIES: short-chain fatty acyl-CoA regulator family protein [unclassified Acidocella]|uniref:helix-turn-helix domain-containing protein n=1 Tax=unclassified Acidocella TaxID=2648610 RepID=UPI00034AE6DC|nr:MULTISPECIES: helix-turn-helix transcriptional regulator [unclassified Acidocella]WBO58414.1 short-chain fatty acyl-CoA regulator family protein [Acidocella sp. MX-AZ03]
MSKVMIGKTIRRLRMEQGFTQQGLAQKLGISTSYLNLVEHDQRNVTASLLFKLTETLKVDLAALSGTQEREFEVALREVFTDPQLGADAVPESELQALAAAPNAARAVLALHRALAGAREEGTGITLPSGRKILLPNEEVRDFFHAHENHFPALEDAAEAIGKTLDVAGFGSSHALAERLRRQHGLVVQVRPLPGSLRVFDAANRMLTLSEDLPRESRGFQMAFQLALLEARAPVEAIVKRAEPTTRDAAELLRIGLLNYIAAALMMPYEPFLEAAQSLRYDVDGLAARFGVSYEQACQRLSSMQRAGQRGVPFFFLRVDAAGNVSKRFSAAGFPFMRYGGTCPRWVAHSAFATPGAIRVQVAQLSATETFLCFARAITGRPARWGEPAPVRVVAMGCDVSHARSIVYGDGLDLAGAAVGIGLSCRLCERQECRSRAFPPIAHRLALSPDTTSASPYRFKSMPGDSR